MAKSVLDEALLVGDDAFGELVLVRHAQQGDNQLGDPARPRGDNVELSELGDAADYESLMRSVVDDVIATLG